MSRYATTIKTQDAHHDFTRPLMCGKTWFEIMEDKSEPCVGCDKLNKCLTRYAKMKPGKRNRKRKAINEQKKNMAIY